MRLYKMDYLFDDTLEPISAQRNPPFEILTVTFHQKSHLIDPSSSRDDRTDETGGKSRKGGDKRMNKNTCFERFS